jgi:hypothetical protein
MHWDVQDQKAMNLDELPWTIAEGKHEDFPIVFRFRQFPNDFPRSDYSQRLNIFWQVSDEAGNGMPSPEESDRISVFEDRIIETTEHDSQSVLSLVITGKNQREFVFHTPNTKEFLKRLTQMPQEEEPYPIEIHHNEDPAWDYVDRVLSDIQGMPNFCQQAGGLPQS